MRADLAALEEELGHSFSNRDLLVRALTHKSWIYEHPGSNSSGDNEQLEFLGDSILGFLVSDALWRSYPELTEGHLSKLKAQLVSEANLLKVAHAINVGHFLVLGRCEEMSGGRNKKALLADSVEALIAAVYLDGGMEAARGFVQAAIVSKAELLEPAGEPGYTDYKTALQELAQARRLPMPHYAVVQERGPEHSKIFTIEARVGSESSGEAEGPSKKSAGQKAAKLLLGKLRAQLNDNGGKRP
jgi:ribonuclease-3